MADNRKDIWCPACGKKMSKVYLDDLKINVDICDNGCGGIYFDNREFEKVDESHENADKILELYEGKSFQPIYDTQKRVCPTCKTPMVKNGSGTAKNNFTIDVCYSCGAKFLDAYELQKIRDVHTTPEENYEFLKRTFDRIRAAEE